MLDLLHSVFYGDYWFISWTIVLVPFITRLVFDIRHIVKNKKSDNSK